MWIDVSLQNGNEATMGTEEHQRDRLPVPRPELGSSC